MDGNILEGKDSNGNLLVLDLVFEKPIIPRISDYMVVSMTATNTGGVAYPIGSLSVNLGSYATESLPLQKNPDEGGDAVLGAETSYDIYQRTKFYIDGLSHKYYVALGENKFYRYSYSPGNSVLKEDIKNIVIEIPQIEGVLISIEKIEVKKRTFFAVDSHINYFLKNYFNITHINRYLTPAYLFILLMLVLFLFYRLLSYFGHNKNLNLCANKNLHPAEGKNLDRVVIYAMLIISVISVFYFMAANTFYTVKSYWDSYKKHILAGNLDEAYYGFYDFEKFIFRIDELLPPGENLVVLLKGEPVYIMAEMAYNLYPRDIRFLNINSKEDIEILDEINELNSQEGSGPESKSKNAKSNYKYIVILSGEDRIDSGSLSLLFKYKNSGGFVYRLK